MTRVLISRFAEKQLRRIPKHIQEKLDEWIETVNCEGIQEVRLKKSYHDEPLKGKRKAQRSIRLNKQWRAIYIETDLGVEIQIIEVTHHDY